MATNVRGLVKSEVVGLYLNNVRIAFITNVDIRFQNETREVVGTSTVKQFIYGRDQWSAQADGLCAFSEGYSFDYIMSMLNNFQTLTIRFFTNESNTEYMEGSVLIESVDLKGGNSGTVVQLSMGFIGSGALNRVIIDYTIDATSPKVDSSDAVCGKNFLETYYISNENNSYPYLQIGDQIWLDAAHTIPLSGFANKFIGIKYDGSNAYQLNASGEVQSILSVTCPV